MQERAEDENGKLIGGEIRVQWEFLFRKEEKNADVDCLGLQLVLQWFLMAKPGIFMARAKSLATPGWTIEQTWLELCDPEWEIDSTLETLATRQVQFAPTKADIHSVGGIIETFQVEMSLSTAFETSPIAWDNASGTYVIIKWAECSHFLGSQVEKFTVEIIHITHTRIWWS